MKNEQKQSIAAELNEICKKASQYKVAKRLGISPGTISQIINHKWEMIADDMWRKLQVNLRIDFGWNTADTKNFKMLQNLMKNAQEQSISVAISHNAGAGKSHSYKYYERSMDNVVYLECKSYWTRKIYLKSLCKASGLEDKGAVDELVERFITHLRSLHKPLVIIDQLDKLNDAALDLFMDFYNDLDRYCGFLVSGVPALKKRILRGCQFDKTGYKEFYSRIGKTFIYLDDVAEKDVAMICLANGVDDQDFINHSFHLCEGDLRKIRREIDKYFLIRKRMA
ncbi:AAA family ATPase [Pedobacter cryoconitis]|uniref:DNA transposition AAA+ family ATPase n=1 Tax=Pedobacter cryoconitis TaxID=188932 RepID=A0A7X0J129_9SPHI|nr:AAA family ATPase [Pedobacter cryoconitis]MBB6499131.1 DNA transposition AAA+ family ATPase [Pedobacter cryoconitis]